MSKAPGHTTWAHVAALLLEEEVTHMNPQGDPAQDRLDRPWHVREVVGNCLLETFDTEEAAQTYADRANVKAEGLGIVTRYDVEAK